MKYALSFLSLFIIIAFFSCKKKDTDINSTEPPVVIGNISGNVILPVGTPFDINAYLVTSPIGASAITNAEYNITAYTSEYTSLFVTDTSGNTILMGYNYPGMTDNAISVSSTALALVMTTPLVLPISPNGKKSFVAKVIGDPNFSALITEVSNTIIAGKYLFDPTNTNLYKKINNIINSAGHKATGSNATGSPVYFTQSGNTLTFYNGENIFSTVVGIYKNGNRVSEIVLGGAKVIPSSVEDVIDHKGSIIWGAPPAGQSYEFDGDGQYNIQIRTGFPGSGLNDKSVDYKRADYINSVSLLGYLWSTFIPIRKSDYASCFENTSLSLQKLYDAGVKFQNGEASSYYTVFDALKDYNESIGQCLGISEVINKPYMAALKKIYKFIDVGSGLLGGSANLSYYIGQWYQANPSFDTCFNVTGNGNIVKSCNAVAPALKIGDMAFGGIIFYLNDVGEHGMVYSLDVLGNNIWWDNTCIVNNKYVPQATGATDTAFGSGKSNTNKIIAKIGMGNNAAALCVNYRGGGYSDWFLPSFGEALRIHNITSLFSSWTSTETLPDNNNLTYGLISETYQYIYLAKYDKNHEYYVRAVRSF